MKVGLVPEGGESFGETGIVLHLRLAQVQMSGESGGQVKDAVVGGVHAGRCDCRIFDAENYCVLK